MSSGNLRKELFRRNFEILLLCVPVILVLFVFNYLPMGGVVLAFKNWKPIRGIWGSPWIGWQNFEFMFRSPVLLNALRNTILYSLAHLVLGPIFGVSFAVMLYEAAGRRATKIYQTIYFLPYFLSWVVVSIMLYAFLSSQGGLLNGWLKGLGLQPVAWYSEAKFWPVILVLMQKWQHLGYSTIVYYAALMGIDPGLYEAAAIDGANLWQRTWRITIPMLTPMIVVLTILGLGRIFFADFGLHYQVPLQSSALLPAVDVINYFTYRALIGLGDIGMGAAVGLFQSTMGLLLVVATNWAANKISAGEHGLF